MKFKFRFADQIVGLFVLTSVVLLCIALILIGINKRWLRDDLIYRSIFTSAKSFRIGMNVNLKGFKIGELKSIELNENNLVDVTIVIYEEYISKVLPNSVLEAQVSPIGLGSQLVFYPGFEKGDPLEENSFIQSTAMKEGREIVKRGLADKGDAGDPIDNVLKDVDEMILSLNTILIDLDESLMGYNAGTPLGEIFLSLESIMPHVDNILEDVNKNTLPAVDGILKDFNVVSSSIAKLGSELDNLEDLIPKILSPEGSIATFLDDDDKLFNEVYFILEEAHKSMSQIRQLTEYLNGLSPEISALVEGTSSTIEEAEKVLQGLKNNPLLKGGIEIEKEQDSLSSTMRDGEF